MSISAKVIDVLDGDTLECAIISPFDMSSIVSIRVRLFGVDTPEVYHSRHKNDADAARAEKILGKKALLEAIKFLCPGAYHRMSATATERLTSSSKKESSSSLPEHEVFLESLSILNIRKCLRSELVDDKTAMVTLTPRKSILDKKTDNTVDVFGRLLADVDNVEGKSLADHLVSIGAARMFTAKSVPWPV